MGERETRGERKDLFLKGQSVDFVNMERAVGHHLYNRVQNLHMRKEDVKSSVETFFQHCKEKKYKPMLYYTGHGEMPTGNWCMADGTVGIEEIFDWVPTGMEPPTICTDSCFGGVWADYCFEKNIPGFQCLSATKHYQAAYDHTGKLFSTIEPYILASNCEIKYSLTLKRLSHNNYSNGKRYNVRKWKSFSNSIQIHVHLLR